MITGIPDLPKHLRPTECWFASIRLKWDVNPSGKLNLRYSCSQNAGYAQRQPGLGNLAGNTVMSRNNRRSFLKSSMRLDDYGINYVHLWAPWWPGSSVQR
jgi:hypothetical protein